MAEPAKLHVESPRGPQTLLLKDANAGKRVTEILRRHQLPLNTRCGQRGLCDGCMVELVAGQLIHKSSGNALESGSARCCEYRVGPDGATLRIPARSLLAYEPQVVSEFRINVPRSHDPLCPSGLGAAIDIGTTTVAVVVVDLRDGTIVGSAAGFNKQMHFGDDVATRIGLCATEPDMVRQLQEAIRDQTIRPLLAAANPSGEPLQRVTVAGNTTMLHLLAGVDPSPMGVFPFAPQFLEHRVLDNPPTHLLPGGGAYVGADLVAGVFASGLVYDDGPSLLVDVGTNGEIILKHGDRLLGCATAAGPAFEGAGLSHGVRATDGAIERVHFDAGTTQVEVIGNATPIGLCGSAYVDFLAEAHRAGLLNRTGRFIGSAEKLVDAGDGGKGWRVAQAAGKVDLLVTEMDVSLLLQAKAAVAAGILTLLARAGLTPSDVKTVYLAGGFGMHLDVGNAIGCGLLPGFVPKQVQVVGNTSLAGAYLALLDTGVLDELNRISQRLEIVELNLDEQFESRYIEQLMLPD